MHSRKLNWTQLNSTELDRSVKFSWVQFSFPLWIEPATSCDARRRFLTVKNRQRPSPVVASSQVVAVSMHSGKLNWTERSSSVEFSWVEFSSVQFPAVYWALESEKNVKNWRGKLWWLSDAWRHWYVWRLTSSMTAPWWRHDWPFGHWSNTAAVPTHTDTHTYTYTHTCTHTDKRTHPFYNYSL